jgi:hypothetical protein
MQEHLEHPMTEADAARCCWFSGQYESFVTTDVYASTPRDMRGNERHVKGIVSNMVAILAHKHYYNFCTI